MNKLLITLLLIVSWTFFWSCDPDAPGTDPSDLDFSSIVTLDITGFDFNSTTKTADFGTVEVSSSSTLAATIKNTSTSSITIDSISNDNTTDFAVNSAALPLTVAAGAETSFSVAFTPSTNTALTASITITLSTDVSLSETITLNGTGNYAPSVVFGVTVSSTTAYTELNGFYTKQTDSYDSDNEWDQDDGRPLYKMTSGATDYFLYYYQNDQTFWGIKDIEPDFGYPYYEEGVNGPLAFIETYSSNSFYPPEIVQGEGTIFWIENSVENEQITVETGITQTSVNTLTADYQYSDADGDSEGSSTYKWYIYSPGETLDPVNGTYSVIPGAASKTYEITGSDDNCYIKVGVTALDSNGFDGAEVISDPYYANYTEMEI